MQGKGLIKFFFYALVIVCIYQLSFTWVARNADKKIQEYAEAQVPTTVPEDERVQLIADQKEKYEAQHANDNIYNIGIVKYNYDEVKSRAMNLGLDLQGGMSVVLEVSKYDLIKSLANDPKNLKLNQALDIARTEGAAGDGDLIELFVKQYEKTNPDSQLAPLFRTKDNNDELSATASNADVLKFLKDKSTAGINSTYTKLKQRIDKFGVSQPYVTLQASTGRIIVELPGVDNPKRARELLQSTANLEFWETWTNSDPEITGGLNQANNILKELVKNENSTPADTAQKSNTNFFSDTAKGNVMAADPSMVGSNESASTASSATDPAESLAVETPPIDSVSEIGPLATILTSVNSGGPSPEIGLVNTDDTSILMEYLAMDEVKAQFPSNIKFMLSAAPADPKNPTQYALYAMKLSPDSDEPLLGGDVIKSASPDRNPLNGQVEVTMSMNSEGAKAWKRVTSENVGKFIAIALDDRIYSAPRVNEEIPNGRSSISGNFEQKDAELLSNILEVGKLPVPSRIIQEDIVGPSLGADAIRSGILSMIVGLLLVVAFMAIYYSTAGIIADIALFANIFFIFGVLASIGATLTLPGIAGLVLTMGMAVDANVIIYERVREELLKGKSMVKAIADGYSGSYSAIIDSHVTTFIIGFILLEFGSGPVKGFAVVLMIGIIFSLFTAIFISRLILDWMAKTDKKISYYTHLTKGAFKNVNFKFIQNRRYGYIASIALTIIGLFFMIYSGFNMGVEFKGGRSYTVRFEHAISADDVRHDLEKEFDKGVQVKTYSSNDRLKITTSYMIGSGDLKADSLATAGLFQHLQKYYSSGIDYKIWDSTYKESQMKVEPTIAKDIQASAIRAIIFALLATFIYIFIRFRRWQFGVAAVVSLIHDAFMTTAMFAILKNVMPFTLQIDETFIAAILTIIGYSIMDTVVVFDRIREYLKESRSGTIPEIFNSAINQTLSRTVITSGVTLLSIIVLLFFGNDNIQGFAFAMFIGIGFGTYSSVFIASAIAVDSYKKELHTEAADKVMK